MHKFVIDFTDGLLVSSTRDPNISVNESEKIKIRVFSVQEKTKKILKTYPDQLGTLLSVEEVIVDREELPYTTCEIPVGYWVRPTTKRYFVPYHVEIFYKDTLCIKDSIDCKFKLVNFSLFPKDERELYTWMNVIKLFKKQMQCDISVKNDLVFSTKEFDDIVDLKYQANDPNTQYYLGLQVGRFFKEDEKTPDLDYHPDGLHNKNSLEIINEILWYNTNYF